MVQTSRHRTQPRTCWPTAEQELLLQAALRPPSDAGEAFARWERGCDPYELDEGSRRLLPLVHRNLRRAGVETSVDDLLWRTWVDASGRNQVLLRTLEHVLTRLHEAGVPTLVLKGAALTILYYRDRGARPMADLDVMVPLDLVARTLEVLRADGWEVELPWRDRPVLQLTRMRHAVALRRNDDEFDLHWHALGSSVGTDLEVELWASSVPMDVGGQTTRALAPVDQLLHGFVHGLRYNAVPGCRWIADAHVVITASGDALDWDLLLHRADQNRLGAWVAAAIVYLDGQFSALVPRPVVAAARALPVTRQEQRVFEHSIRAPSHWVLETWRDYRWREGNRSMARAATGFAEELRVLYDLDSVWKLPERAARGIQQRWRSAPNGTGDEQTD